MKNNLNMNSITKTETALHKIKSSTCMFTQGFTTLSLRGNIFMIKKLRALPRWFGIESVIQDYIKNIQTMEAWAYSLPLKNLKHCGANIIHAL